MPGARQRVLYQFKEMLYIGKDYPMPYDEFKMALKRAYRSKRELVKLSEIEKALEHGEYIKREMIALHQLRRYRAIKRNYYRD